MPDRRRSSPTDSCRHTACRARRFSLPLGACVLPFAERAHHPVPRCVDKAVHVHPDVHGPIRCGAVPPSPQSCSESRPATSQYQALVLTSRPDNNRRTLCRLSWLGLVGHVAGSTAGRAYLSRWSLLFAL